jgi:hypothetical protein
MKPIEISTILYQEGECWIAQGLEYDITVQASSPTEVYNRFAVKVVTEMAISMDLHREPLEGIGKAPEHFWRMYEEAQMTVQAEPPNVRISDGDRTPQVIPKMKIGQPIAA